MKNLLYILLFVPLFIISSCEDQGPIHGCLDSQALNYNPEAAVDNNSCEYAAVGNYAVGGIIFYIDETGEHGLVAALGDLTEGATDPLGLGYNGYEWGCSGTGVDGADGLAIGTGYQNSMDIENQGCSTYNGGITALKGVLDAEINGYSDWYLPSKDELSEMYNTIGSGGPDGNLGGFETSNGPHYWSSSEYWTTSEFDYHNAWRVSFGSGSLVPSGKSNVFRVRAIRSF